MTPLVFSTYFLVRSSLSTDSYDKSSCFLAGCAHHSFLNLLGGKILYKGGKKVLAFAQGLEGGSVTG